MEQPGYQPIIEHYEACLERHGDTHLGVDWSRPGDARMRYQVMLDVIRPGREPVSLLDFGCGASHLYEYIQQMGLGDRIRYTGLDVSEKFVALSRAKFPHNTYYQGDVLTSDLALPTFDYVILNGVLTVKRHMTFDDMWAYAKRLLLTIYPMATRGLAFNAMSKHVDWEREELFHLPFDLLMGFLKKELSRHVVLRADYGLYDFTAYLYREPLALNNGSLPRE